MKRIGIAVLLLLILNFFVSADFDFGKIKDKVSEFTLDNGLKFILLEDHSVPIASFVTYVNVGGSDEKIGIYGISHFLEHMAFKGTPEIGTNNYKMESKVMEKMDQVFNSYLAEKDSLTPDPEKLEKYGEELKKLEEEGALYVDANALDTILKRNGAVGLNAGTSKDATIYFVSLPSNRVELWAYLESSRFINPVFRELYKERKVIMEERRQVVENNPIGKLFEELLSLAFKVHPYRVNGIGPMSNIEHITRDQMTRYFKDNYTARNMVIGVAGDVYPDQLKKLAGKYFARLNPGRKNPRIFSSEPAQLGEKTVTLYDESQPALVVGYHCPSILHEDFVKFSVLDYLLTTGRSSRLNKKMVIQDKTALVVGSMAGAPGNKYPSLYLLFALPNMGHDNDELLNLIDSELEKIKEGAITPDELDSAKTRIKVNTLQGIKSRVGVMMSLLGAEVLRGSWEMAFDDLALVEKITVSDIQELVKKYMVKKNRSIARMEKKAEVSK